LAALETLIGGSGALATTTVTIDGAAGVGYPNRRSPHNC
jgi:hypothetical protein